ncbi:MAG: 15-cis-phytoene synthase [Thermoanaerobaculia bacterium]|jgi:phytoene synthase|nr:15-cis-phytoene synthase [Thermoanaerobaculia bacterium]
MSSEALPLPVSPTVDEAYAFCRRIAHRYGSNFSVGFRFLPLVKRKAVYAAYAWCRWADDIADEPSDSSKSVIDRLAAWQSELDATYAGRPSHPITLALADAIQHFAIPKSAFVALIDGCRQDMIKTRYQTFDELLQYCELVASSISDISLAIYGYRTSAALDYGRNLATALQLTNVTRDVADDLERDRVYLPQEELTRFGVTEKDLFERKETEAMRRLIEFQIERAAHYFRAAEPLVGELSFDARFPTLLMGGVYATVLAKLRRTPFVVLRKRLSLSRVQKIMVIARRLIRPRFV